MPRERMRRILVTGGAGFIGSCFARSLLDGSAPDWEELEHLTVLDNLTYAGNPANLAPVSGDPRLTFVKGDIGDRGLLGDVLPGHDLVVNFAAESHVDRSISDPDAFVRTNVSGAHTLFEASRHLGVHTVVQVSTDEVYGSIAEGSWDEDAPPRPNSPYSASKAGADLLALAYAGTYGYDIRVTRCSNNYGPYQFPEKVVPLFVTNLLDGHDVPLYGDGGNVRDWIHVDDHCRGIRLVAQAGTPGAVYNVGGGAELTNRELTGLLLDACGADRGRVRRVPDRKNHDRRYSMTDRKLRALGYRPEIDFASGLAGTVDWYRENRQWWEPLKSPPRD